MLASAATSSPSNTSRNCGTRKASEVRALLVNVVIALLDPSIRSVPISAVAAAAPAHLVGAVAVVGVSSAGVGLTPPIPVGRPTDSETHAGRGMDTYYHPRDLAKFADMGKDAPELWKKFLEWYGAVFAEGALSEREKALIALAVVARRAVSVLHRRLHLAARSRKAPHLSR